jgi:hypothetical protein
MSQYIIVYIGGNQPSSPEEGKQNYAKYREWLSSLGDAAVSPANPFKNTSTVNSGTRSLKRIPWRRHWRLPGLVRFLISAVHLKYQSWFGCKAKPNISIAFHRISKGTICASYKFWGPMIIFVFRLM